MATIQDLKVKAGDDHDFAQRAETTLAECGAPIPAALQRLRALSKAVLDMPEQSSVSDPTSAGPDPRIVALAKDLGSDGSADPVPVIAGWIRGASEIINGLKVARDAARKDAAHAIRDSASVLLGVAKDLDGNDAGTIVVTSPAQKADAPNPAPPPARAAIGLSHGLVLEGGTPPRRILFLESAKDRWVCHVIADDGRLGPETATKDGVWFSDAWTRIQRPESIKIPPHWSEARPAPANDTPVQTTIPGSGPEPPPTAATAKMKGADWNPTEEQIAGYVNTLGEKVGAGKVTLDAVKGLVATFKTEKASADLANPGVSFFHWAVKRLKG